MRHRRLNARAEMIAGECDPCRYGAVIHSKRIAQKQVNDGRGEALIGWGLTGKTATDETAVDLGSDAP